MYYPPHYLGFRLRVRPGVVTLFVWGKHDFKLSGRWTGVAAVS